MSSSPPTVIQAAAQLSAHLKSLRKALGLTQAELGQRIGVKQVRVADIERDPGAISVEQLLEVLHALNARLLLARNGTYAPAASNAAVKAKEPGPSW